ncbi:hypothetical protein GCM10023347_43680 [Streptomyces chumphonensis]
MTAAVTHNVSRYSRTGSPEDAWATWAPKAHRLRHGEDGGRFPGPSCPRPYAGAGTPVSAVTTGSSARLISSPTLRKYVIGAPYGS